MFQIVQPLGTDKPKIVRENELCLQLQQRAPRTAEEVYKLTSRESALSLCDF